MRLQASVKAFLSTCRSPAVVEEGETPIALVPGCFSLELRRQRLWIEAFTESRTLSRRLLSVDGQRSGILDCTFSKFGGAPGKLAFLDLDRPQTAHRQLQASRASFGAQFRRMLHRQLPQWEITRFSCSMDLRRSFSPLYPRATLTRGSESIVAAACSTPEQESGFLTAALLWYDHARSNGSSLCLFLPEGSGLLTAHRLRWLNRHLLRPRLFLFNEHGSAGEVDPQDLGNLETRVSPQYVAPHLSGSIDLALQKLLQFPNVSAVPDLDGSMSLRYQGTEFARVAQGRLLLGLSEQQEVQPSEVQTVENFVLELINIPQSAPALPERWLEGAIRTHLTTVAADLLPSPVHGQVLTFAGLDRDALDLLAVSHGGQLTILELKASEDLHLPLQALDYWIRIKWHAERQELDHLFPGIPLAARAPRLLLVAPALSFHSSNPTVLRYFSPEVAVERIGVNSDWQTHFKVVMRLTGANTPHSHGRSDGNGSRITNS